MLAVRFGKLEDGYMTFSKAPGPVGQLAAREAAE